MAGDKYQPAIAMPMVINAKAPAAVPNTRRAPSTSFRPQAWPMRMVEAIPKPNTNEVSRNITMFELDVAASALSPRKRPTQIALIVPFSDWRIDDASVGSAKASRVGPMLPCVRSPRGPLRAPASAMFFLAEPLQRRAQPFCLSRFGFMVGASLVDRFGLGALGEGRVRQTLGQPVAV